MPAPSKPESRALAKLSWEAAWERLDNALRPLPGDPPATPEQLAECFEVAQAQLDEVRAAYGVPADE